MSGLRKAKKYDWKDSNLALFGSDIEKNVKKDSAVREEAWKGAGESVGIKIWRIVEFKVTDWPKEDYGKFYNGDSYIILNTYKDKKSDELLYDIHFWIGKKSTQDEYGTAAYKTVELDTFLNDKPVQHREVENHESHLFKSYFPQFECMDGGAESGFKYVAPEKYEKRLLKFNDEGRNKVKVAEVEMFRESITVDNVYILDNGLTIYQINGSQSDKDERFKAAQYVNDLKNERGNVKLELLGDNFQSKLHLPSRDCSEDAKDVEDSDFNPTMFKLSDEDGQLKFTKLGDLSKSKLESADVFIVDTGKQCFVWIGKEASRDERMKGIERAHNYLMETKHPLIPVTVLKEGQQSSDFDIIF